MRLCWGNGLTEEEVRERLEKSQEASLEKATGRFGLFGLVQASDALRDPRRRDSSSEPGFWQLWVGSSKRAPDRENENQGPLLVMDVVDPVLRAPEKVPAYSGT